MTQEDTNRAKDSNANPVQMPCFPISAVAWVLTVNQTHTVDFILILHFFLTLQRDEKRSIECTVPSCHLQVQGPPTHTASWPLEPTRVTYGKFQVHGFIWLASHQFLSGWQLRALPPQVQSTDQGFHRKQADSFQHKAFLSSLTWQLPRKQCCEKEDPGRSKPLWSSRPDVNSYS